MVEKHLQSEQATGAVNKRERQGAWTRIVAGDTEALTQVRSRLGLDLAAVRGYAAVEEHGFFILPIEVPVRQDECYRAMRVISALGREEIITFECDGRMQALDRAQWQITHAVNGHHLPEALAIMVRILTALNDAAHETVDGIALALDGRAEEVLHASGGLKLHGRQAGVADIADTAVALGEAEELIARVVEGQLHLMRATRWLRRMAGQHANGAIATLASDIAGAKRHARFLHEQIRSLQQSLMTTLDLKQNQIIKVFAVVTAVFTPPTLVAAFYGQNFAYMPELGFPWAEWAVIGMIGAIAILPLFYIKKKGWLR